MKPAHAGTAVFLDRDGTLLDELGYLADPEALRLLPGAARAVARLNAAGVPVVLFTNQSGIARGLFDEQDLERVHRRLAERLAAEGAHLDGILYCPHHPEEGQPPLRAACTCRKPRPGMIQQACELWDLDATRSFVIGDAERDLEAGLRAGLPHRILVRTGQGARTLERWGAQEGEHCATLVVDDLPAAVEHVLEVLARVA